MTALLAYYLLTAPVQAAEAVRGLLDQLTLAADSGVSFLRHLGT